MSETASTPAPDAAAPTAETTGPVSPPPVSQPALSVTEAARLLGRRRQGTDGADATPGKPAETAPTKPVERGLSAMERALGVPEGAPAAPPSPVADDGIELNGTRYSRDQLAEALRQAADYTKKTQTLAEQTRALEAQRDSLATVLPYIQPELARLQELVNGTTRPDPGLLRTDPARYWEQREAYERAVDEQARLGNLTQLQQQAQARAMEAQVNAAHEQLAKEFSFWADPQERAKAQADIVEWALSKGGYNRDELRGLADARHLKVMMKAAIYDKWVAGAKTAAPVSQLAAPVRGAPPPPPPTERISTAQQSFESKPNIRTGAALLTARRANGTTPR